MLIKPAVAIFSNGHKLILLLPAEGLIRRESEMRVGKSSPAITQIKAANGCNQPLMHVER